MLQRDIKHEFDSPF